MGTNIRYPRITDSKVARIRRRILRWSRENYQEYSWRTEESPWLSLVAEFMLQRTRASQVEPVFQEFRSVYPKPADYVNAAGTGAISLLGRLGLRKRGRLLLDIAKSLEERGGVLPESMEELQEFSGIGPYTAAAWLSLHRSKRAVITDSNVVRWLGRWTGRAYEKDPRGVKWIAALADRLTPQRAFRRYNYAIIDFSMMICTISNPSCDICPIKRDCHYASGTSSVRGRLSLL